MAQQPRDYGKEAVDRHRETRGKVSIAPKMTVETLDDLSIAYTPGVATVCMAIHADVSESYHLTNRANTVAVITDGSEVLGLGNIGLRVARICQALEMRVLGMRRSVTEPLEGQSPTDLLLPPRDLPLILQQSDFLIICLPGTHETLGLLGERELQQMKQGSYLINVGRGGIVDEEALVRLLRTGHLAGAALDVFAQEPLPTESPLWDEPGLLLTAHIAGNSLRYEERATDLFLENLGRYLEGQDLLNVYDPDRGY